MTDFLVFIPFLYLIQSADWENYLCELVHLTFQWLFRSFMNLFIFVTLYTGEATTSP